ncbi:MAG: ASKHA domain-containing protein [Lachnospiraceae bacterium]|nr:ASKHA domain-containing protein [Lachnospiraceae bacterium]
MKIRISGNGKKSIKALLEEQGVSLYAPCGGRGTCGMCVVTVLSGSCPPSETDRDMLREEDISRGMRLACMTFPTGEITVETVDEAKPVILTDYETATSPSADPDAKISSPAPASHSGLSGQMPPENNHICVGIDIGTTTVVLAVLGSDGHPSFTRSFLNPLRRYGADVVSLIEAASGGKLGEMRDLLRNEIESELRNLAKHTSPDRAGKISSDITESNPAGGVQMCVAVAGNTVMTHIFMGWVTSGLGTFPFKPHTLSFSETTLCGFTAYVFPGISAFVGGDIVAGIYGLDLINGQTGDMLMDLGTNGEIVLKTDNGLIASSASAGPALEGAHISCGTGCVEGAVTGITLENLRPVLTVAGAQVTAPASNKGLAGACGSAILELTDELLRTGILRSDGSYVESYADEGFAFGTDRNGRVLALTQADVRELQLAKGAVNTAALMLCEKGGVDPRDLNISLAGGMGSGLRPERIKRTGIIPACASVHAVGNSVLCGLMKFLGAVSDPQEKNTAVKVLSDLAAGVVVYDLALDKNFEERFLKSLSFG